MLKIYGHATSINVRKVLWTCEERDTRALNPTRMVPVIDDGGVIVWESNVIVRYLPHYSNVERYYHQLLQRRGFQLHAHTNLPG
jgi:glutathione S-transferase